MQPQVVHEAEVHRQHIRLKIPISVEIDGTAFTVDDWSMGGFGIMSEMTSRQPGERFAVKLMFPFEDFDVTLRLDCQMVYILEDNTRFGCRFLGLSQGQLALFRYLVDAYLSGEIVSGGDILAIAGRDNTAASASAAPASIPMPRRRPGDGGSSASSATARSASPASGSSRPVGLGVQERFFTVRAESAVIHTPIVPAAGARPRHHGAADPADPVEPRAPRWRASRPMTGGSCGSRARATASTYEWLVQPGQFAEQGEEMALLVAADQPLLVRAQVAFDKATGLGQGDLALIDVPGRRADAWPGRADRFQPEPAARRRYRRNRAQPTASPRGHPPGPALRVRGSGLDGGREPPPAAARQP
jgi:hypothetical protein